MSTALLSRINTDYDKVGQYNQDAVNGFSEEMLDRMIDLVNPSQCSKILDAMAGNGNLTIRLYHYCQRNGIVMPSVTLLEFSEVQCKFAKKQLQNFQDIQSEVIWGDVITMEDYKHGRIFPDNVFDRVMIKSGNHEIHLEKQIDLYKSIFRVLKPGGLFVNLGFLFDNVEERDQFRKLVRFKDRMAGMDSAVEKRHVLTRGELYSCLQQAGFVDVQCGMHIQYTIHSWVGVQAYFPRHAWERMHAALQAQWAKALILRRNGRIHFQGDSGILICPGEITVARRPC
jgi:ubiquinone/menaquinone biosynthesis C-methylase UbiE